MLGELRILSDGRRAQQTSAQIGSQPPERVASEEIHRAARCSPVRG